jgi:LPS-assembly protein
MKCLLPKDFLLFIVYSDSFWSRKMTLPNRKPIYFWVLLALGPADAFAAGWDCLPGDVGKDWVCVSGTRKPTVTGLNSKIPSASPKAADPKTRSAEEPKNSSKETESSRSKTAGRAKPAETENQADESERQDEEESTAPEPSNRQTPVKKAGPEPNTPPPVNSNGSATPAPEGSVTTKSGWNCRPSADKTWDCSLSGPDSHGEAHVVGTGESQADSWSQSSDMTRQDEQRFSRILARMPADPWALSCGLRKNEHTVSSEFLLSDADRTLREKSPLQITADRAELVHGEASNYLGGAELKRADQSLFGDFVTHNSKGGVINAKGEVIYREKGLALSGDTAFMKLNSDEGILRNSQFILETVPARGTSRVTHIDSKTKSRYETATYTTCPPGNQDWMLHASHVTLDKDAGRGTAKNAWLKFKGVPFLYTPWMSFPIDDRRKSGFLAPYFGYSKLNGFDFTLPYYLNLAPNYDLTLLPRVLSNRGELLRSDFRYLTDYGVGRLFFDIMPWDRQEQKTRGQVGWINQSRFTDKITSQIDLHLVSDNLYIQQLGNLLAINNTTFLRSFATLNYGVGELFGGTYTANLMVDYYQSLDPTITDQAYPYRRMPQLNLTYNRAIGDTGLQFQSAAEITRFDQQYLVNGERLNLRPRIFYPFRDVAGYVTPSLSLQHTEYWLQNIGPTESSNFSMTAPIFSVDSGAYFEKEFELFDSPMQQTLEPRLFYLFVPKVTQPYEYNAGYTPIINPYTELPIYWYNGLNFDSAEYDFNFYQLFRENRFAGVDRISDANNITPALTTRLISQDSGLERLKLSVGKVFYLKDPQVVLSPAYNPPPPTYKNNIVGEVSSMLSEHWSLRSATQWNPSFNRLDRQQAVLQYNNFNNNLLNISYRYRRDPYDGSTPRYPDNPLNPRTINQTDISTRLPIGWGWFAIGRWQYNLASNVTVEAMAGVEKETCCWRFSLIGLRYANGVQSVDRTVFTPAGATTVAVNETTMNNAVFFQFELKGLGRFGDQVDTLLLQNFSGYRTDYELPGIYRQAAAN